MLFSSQKLIFVGRHLLEKNAGRSSFGNRREFYELKKILLAGDYQLRFFESNITELFSKSEITNYDLIYYSDILLYKEVPANQIFPILDETYQEHLNQNGICLANYFHASCFGIFDNYCATHANSTIEELGYLSEEYDLILRK